jgi:hypothetical protein
VIVVTTLCATNRNLYPGFVAIVALQDITHCDIGNFNPVLSLRILAIRREPQFVFWKISKTNYSIFWDFLPN